MRLRVPFCVFGSLALAISCSSPATPAADASIAADARRNDSGGFVCAVVPPTECTDPSLRYADIEPIIASRCQGCHDGSGDQWPLTSYSHVADWFDLVPPEVRNCSMPPPEEGVPMTDEERVTLLTWYLCGFPE